MAVGTMVAEFYGNTVTNASGTRWIHLQGGWALIHDNVLTGTALGISLSDLAGSADSVVGEPTQLDNAYFWNNTVNGSQVILTVLTDTYGTLAADNSRHYALNTSFDGIGQHGVGAGTSVPTAGVAESTDQVGATYNFTVSLPTVSGLVLSVNHDGVNTASYLLNVTGPTLYTASLDVSALTGGTISFPLPPLIPGVYAAVIFAVATSGNTDQVGTEFTFTV